MKIYFTRYFVLLMILLSPWKNFAQENDQRIFNDSTVHIAEIGTNTERSDFGPFVVNKTLYFTTYSDKILGKTDKKLRANAFYDLYKAKIDSNGNTIGKREVVKEFYTQFHDGPVAFCPKTGELFVTQSYDIDPPSFPESLKTKTIRLHIMIAVNVNGKWERITDFPFSNPAYSVGHPAISENGDTLVFSSDMPGGFGETDLYYSIRQEGTWQKPVNLGAGINTAGKDEFAYITDRNLGGSKLIFASNGREGLGKLDLFYTRFPFNNDKIEHFSPPVNSAFDDFDLVIPFDAEYGYFASNRPGKGGDDIYKFSFKRIIIPLIRELYVFSTKTLRPIPEANVQFCNNKHLLTDNRGMIARVPDINSDCVVSASSFGYTDNSITLALQKDSRQKEIRDTIWLQPRIRQKITLRNIYYDLDKWDILPESAKELDQLIAFLKENPEMKVELSAHTDSRGNDKYNLSLSQKRAESAVNYVVSKGIDTSRITGKGYGESQLLNRCTNGADCAPEEHRLNRRTEIYLPDFGKAENVIQTQGDFSKSNSEGTKAGNRDKK